jgi:hypothetical protein
MAKVFKNMTDTVEMVIFGIVAVLALAGIVRFIILADVF